MAKSDARVLKPFDTISAVLLFVLAALSLCDAIVLTLNGFHIIGNPYPEFGFGFVGEMIVSNPIAWVPVPATLAVLQASAGAAILKRRRWGLWLAPAVCALGFLTGLFWIPASFLNLSFTASALLTLAIAIGGGRQFKRLRTKVKK